jgi:hypothetical protein
MTIMALNPLPPWSAAQVFQWDGRLINSNEPHQHMTFKVMAGKSAPIPTGGGANITGIDRARRKQFTYATGYNAASMDVPICFDATVSYGLYGWTPAELVLNIQKLNWMWGRGKLYANGTHPAQGDPPIVQVSSGDGKTSTNLIPPDYQSDSASDLRWLISNIAWDTNPIIGPGGDVRQWYATVSLIEYVAVPGAPASPRNRQILRGNGAEVRTITTTAAKDTIAKICFASGLTNSTDWALVLVFNTRLKIRSWNARLKPGTLIQIPAGLRTGSS